jgi:hypothetical protein
VSTLSVRRVRRRKTADARRESVVKVLVTGDEHTALQEASERAGVSLSTWLRLVGMKAAAERA